MGLDKLKNKAMLKMVLPMIDTYLMPMLTSLIQKSKSVKIDPETESEVALLLLARGETIKACAPVFSKDDKIVRYIPLNETGSETIDLTELIKNVKQ